MMRCIDEISRAQLRGKKVLVRAGLDLSLDQNGAVTDTFRVAKAVPTLAYLQESGARVIILSHIGRDPLATNAPVAAELSQLLKVHYIPDLFGPTARSALAAMREGEMVLLENLRQHYDLEKTKDETFARALASLGEIYVNDAFSNSHRDHTSMTTLPALLPHYAGFLVRDEIENLKPALNPPHPAFAIIGGAKFETKDPVVRLFLERYDHVYVTGAIANDILRVQGFPVGRSRISEHAPAREVVDNSKLIAPVDVVAEREDKQAHVKKPNAVEAGDKIVDMGPDTMALLTPVIQEARFIIWNGPTGLYEDGYLSWTRAIAEQVAKRAEAGIPVLIGGGDTIAAIQQSGLPLEGLGFLSTGGGAMLEYLLKGTLPAIEALKN